MVVRRSAIFGEVITKIFLTIRQVATESIFIGILVL